MGEPLPVYPAAMSTLAQTTTGPARWYPTRATAALLAFTAVVLVIAGSFVPLYTGTLSAGPQDLEVTISAWSADIRGNAEPGDVPTVGYPLVFAAIILACAAALCWYAATPAAGPGVGRVSGMTTAIGGAFLIGTVWTTALLVANGVDAVLLLGIVTPGLETEASYLTGYWLLLVAALLGLAAAVLALIPVRPPTWAQVYPDAATPPYCLAMPAQLPPTAAPHVLQVDPLTGRPLTPSPPAAHAHFAPAPPPAAESAAVHAPADVGAPVAREPVPETPAPAPENHADPPKV